MARHAFRYTGRLTGGDALAPKMPHVNLRRGRAWGIAVATWHATGGHLGAATAALRGAVAEDAAEVVAAGFPDESPGLLAELTAILEHYHASADVLPGFYGAETEVSVAAPSRSGRGRSNRYRFAGYLDGLAVDEAGRTWLVEFKLRGNLTPLQRALLDRQTRWYAWAARETMGVDIAGVILDERLAGAPGPVTLNKPGADGLRVPRRGQAQCDPAEYEAACVTAGVEPDADTLAGLHRKRWHARHYITYKRVELDEAGAQVASVARLVGDLDAGRLHPVRNPSPARCGGCAFLDICAAPWESGVVDALFWRVPPKRDRAPAEGRTH